MPILRVYRHGMTAGIPPMSNAHLRGLRGDVKGWTNAATRSNSRFLYSVDERELTDFDDGPLVVGLAVTLTVKDCPDTAAQWSSMRRAFFMRLQRLGLVRAHWLTEWQRRGVPHMHAAIWMRVIKGQNDWFLQDVVDHWTAVAGQWGAQPRGQDVHAITDSVGWFKYLSKHAVRGLSHYQRSSENIPSGWLKTGRMWGHVGDWPVGEPMRIELDNPGFYAFRRIVRGWRLAGARASQDLSRIRAARKMLRGRDRATSAVRGVSDWFPERLTLPVLTHLASMGHAVRS